MSADPGAEMKVEKKEGKEEIKSYPYLSSLNPAQLKGNSQIPRNQVKQLIPQLSSTHPIFHFKSSLDLDLGKLESSLHVLPTSFESMGIDLWRLLLLRLRIKLLMR
jgi:hypothetical protein